MKSSRAYSPRALKRMTLAYQLACKELHLAGASATERERLATCILAIGNTYEDVNRLLEKSIRIYLRSQGITSPESSRQNRNELLVLL